MGSVFRRGRIWWVKYYRAGRPIRESSNSEMKTEALRLLRSREGQIVEGRFPGLRFQKVTYEELAVLYLRDYEINKKKSQVRAKQLAAHLGKFFNGMRAMEITTTHVMAYASLRQTAGAANGTINRELAALKRMFNLAVRQTPPLIGQVPYIPLLKEDNIRRGFFEHSEFLALRAALPDHLKPVITLGYWTGMREKEILSITWTQIYFDLDLIRLEPGTTKSGEGRWTPLMGDCKRVLEEWRTHTLEHWPNCLWACHYHGHPFQRFTHAWDRACERVGLEGKLFHDLRRTAIRNMVRAGIPERVAMQISGHKTRSVFDRYDIVSEGDLHEAAVRMATWWKRQTPTSEGESIIRERPPAVYGHNFGHNLRFSGKAALLTH